MTIPTEQEIISNPALRARWKAKLFDADVLPIVATGPTPEQKEISRLRDALADAQMTIAVLQQRIEDLTCEALSASGPISIDEELARR